MTFRNVQLAVAFVGLAVSTATPVGAQDKALAIQLNTAADRGDGCRLSFVASNDIGQLLDQVSFEVFTFDDKGSVAQSLVFQFGRFPIGKTKVVQFDLAGQPCSSISRLLVNDATECVIEDKSSTVCIDALKTSTRGSIVFGK